MTTTERIVSNDEYWRAEAAARLIRQMPQEAQAILYNIVQGAVAFVESQQAQNANKR